MAENLTVRTNGAATPVSGGSSSGSAEKSRLDLEVERLAGTLKSRGLAANDEMLRAIVTRKEQQKEQQTARATQVQTTKAAHENQVAVSKRDNSETSQSGARAALLGKTAETNSPDRLTAQQRALVTSDPSAPAVLPPATQPQITAEQAGKLLTTMFEFLTPTFGTLNVSRYAETLTSRPATKSSEERQQKDGQQRSDGQTRSLAQTPVDRPVATSAGQQQTGDNPSRQQPNQQQTALQAGSQRSTTEQDGQSATQTSTTSKSTGQTPIGLSSTSTSTLTRSGTTSLQGTSQTSGGRAANEATDLGTSTRLVTSDEDDDASTQLTTTGGTTASKSSSAKASVRGVTSASRATTSSSQKQTTSTTTGSRSSVVSSVVSASTRATSMSAESSGSTTLSLRSGGSSSRATRTRATNTGGGIDTTTSWDGMHFNWDAFFVKFMFKFQKDEAEARRLMKELRDAMHRVAIEGIKTKIALEKMNQAFERAEKAFELGASIKSLLRTVQVAQTNELFGKNVDKVAGGKDGIDQQLADLTAPFQSEYVGGPSQDGKTDKGQGAAAQSSAPSIVYLTQEQREVLRQNPDPEVAKKYEQLLAERREAAGSLGELAIIGAARDRAKDSVLRQQLDRDYTAKSSEVNTAGARQNGTLTGRSLANQRESMLQEALIHAYVSLAKSPTGDKYSRTGLANIARQAREYNDRFLLQSRPDEAVSSGTPAAGAQDRGLLGTFGHGNDTTASDNAKVQAVIDETKWEKEDSPNAQATKVSVDRLYNELLKSMGNTDLEEGQRTMTAALKASGSSATADDPAFKAAMVQGYREQMARTEAIARGEQPKPSPTAADSTTRIGQALGGSLAGRAMADARKGLLRDMKKQVKLEKIGDMLDAGAGAIAEVAKTLRGDAEKANAEAVAAAQRGASEMDSRIRSNYMQAQGMINQMAHVLRIGRSTH